MLIKFCELAPKLRINFDTQKINLPLFFMGNLFLNKKEMVWCLVDYGSSSIVLPF